MSNAWLCRNCNTLVSDQTETCPKCGAERPTDSGMEQHPDGIEDVVKREEYSNATKPDKQKHTFRESVLVNAADIGLVFGLFCTLAILLMPLFIDDIEYINLWSICGAIICFASAIVSWAILRTIADISRRLRERE